MSSTTWSTTSASDVFKRKYTKASENTYNSANSTSGRINKDYNFTGIGLYMMIPLSFQGGVGSGSLPDPNVADYKQAVISAKKVYSVVLIDRESIKASSNDEGAFVRGLKEVVKKGVESFMRNDSRILYGTGDGALGTILSVTGANPFVLTFAAGYNLANFEENDYVNIETGNTDQFEITLVAEQTNGTLQVTVNRLTGSQIPVATDVMFMQKSENNDPNGLQNTLDATSGSVYGVPVARRWQATQSDAAASSLSADIMNTTMLTIEKACGKAPDAIYTSYAQFGKLLNLLEDHKRYPLGPKYGSDKLKGIISFNAIEFASTHGAIPILPERFCPPDRMYFLNMDKITRFHRPDFGWFDDDGTVFLREGTADSYSARYGGYYDNFIELPFHGRIDNLAV